MPYKNPEDFKLWARKYRKTKKGKAACRKSVSNYQKSEKGKIAKDKYISNNNQKVNARKIALRAYPNKICSIKGCKNNAERHHKDYSKPLDVEFLCKEHHLALEVHNG
jgi:hypothetical protein